MAEEWIKFRKKLIRDGRVVSTARNCNATRVSTLGALVTLWCLADEHCDAQGALCGYTKEDLEKEIGLPGFLSALPNDWYSEIDGTPQLPNYQQHNGVTAKQRAVTLKRVTRHRKRNASSVSKALPEKRREEKRREEISPDGDIPLPPFPQPLNTDAFRAAWTAWETHRREIKKPLTPTCRSGQLAKLTKWGHDRAVAALIHSTEAGWTGIFEPDTKKGKPHAATTGSGYTYDPEHPVTPL